MGTASPLHLTLRTAKDIGLVIRDRRRALSLDQQNLANQVGVSRQWIVEIEKGKPRAEIGLLLRTLGVLGLRMHVAVAPAAVPGAGEDPMDLAAIIANARAPIRQP